MTPPSAERCLVYFEIVGEVEEVEVIAEGTGIRRLAALVAAHGAGRWRKLKGVAVVRLPGGRLVGAELPWYEAHGIGRRRWKIKRLLERR